MIDELSLDKTTVKPKETITVTMKYTNIWTKGRYFMAYYYLDGDQIRTKNMGYIPGGSSFTDRFTIQAPTVPGSSVLKVEIYMKKDEFTPLGITTANAPPGYILDDEKSVTFTVVGEGTAPPTAKIVGVFIPELDVRVHDGDTVKSSIDKLTIQVGIQNTGGEGYIVCNLNGIEKSQKASHNEVVEFNYPVTLVYDSLNVNIKAGHYVSIY